MSRTPTRTAGAARAAPVRDEGGKQHRREEDQDKAWRPQDRRTGAIAAANLASPAPTARAIDSTNPRARIPCELGVAPEIALIERKGKKACHHEHHEQGRDGLVRDLHERHVVPRHPDADGHRKRGEPQSCRDGYLHDACVSRLRACRPPSASSCARRFEMLRAGLDGVRRRLCPMVRSPCSVAPSAIV